MVLESVIGQCASEDVGPPSGLIVRSHIDWIGERNIPYKGVETSPYQTRFKTLRRSLERKAQKEQYLLAVGFGYYNWY